MHRDCAQANAKSWRNLALAPLLQGTTPVTVETQAARCATCMLFLCFPSSSCSRKVTE
jgi:hypothetical protein